MGFSIGSFLGAAAPLIGSAFGPIGAAIGAGIGAGFAPVPQAQSVVGRQTQPVMFQPQQLASIVPVPFGGQRQFAAQPRNGFGTGGFGVQRRRVGFAGPVARLALPMFGAGVTAGAVISDILQRARENSGQRVTKNKIIDSARACGIELTADTFGLSESDVCKVIVAGRSRRRRGVSAADVRRTKRTLRFVRSIKKDLKAVRL